MLRASSMLSCLSTCFFFLLIFFFTCLLESSDDSGRAPPEIVPPWLRCWVLNKPSQAISRHECRTVGEWKGWLKSKCINERCWSSNKKAGKTMDSRNLIRDCMELRLPPRAIFIMLVDSLFEWKCFKPSFIWMWCLLGFFFVCLCFWSSFECVKK